MKHLTYKSHFKYTSLIVAARTHQSASSPECALGQAAPAASPALRQLNIGWTATA
jgi:hypothetical protein